MAPIMACEINVVPVVRSSKVGPQIVIDEVLANVLEDT